MANWRKTMEKLFIVFAIILAISCQNKKERKSHKRPFKKVETTPTKQQETKAPKNVQANKPTLPPVPKTPSNGRLRP